MFTPYILPQILKCTAVEGLARRKMSHCREVELFRRPAIRSGAPQLHPRAPRAAPRVTRARRYDTRGERDDWVNSWIRNTGEQARAVPSAYWKASTRGDLRLPPYPSLFARADTFAVHSEHMQRGLGPNQKRVGTSSDADPNYGGARTSVWRALSLRAESRGGRWDEGCLGVR